MTMQADSAPGAFAPAEQEAQFQQVLHEFGPALARFAAGYELNPENRRDLLQEMHIAIWQSLAIFDSRCSLRTWVYRVAHNMAVKHLLRNKRRALSNLKRLEEVEEPSDPRNEPELIHRQLALQQLTLLITQLKPSDRQLILLYMDDVNVEDIAEITGLARGSVGVKVHRIKRLLQKMFESGAAHG